MADSIPIDLFISIAMSDQFAEYFSLTPYQRHCLLTSNEWAVRNGRSPVLIPPEEVLKIESGYYNPHNYNAPEPDALEVIFSKFQPEPLLPVPQPKFSFYSKPVRNIYPCRQITLAECARLIEYPHPYSDLTSQLRALSPEEDRRKFKAERFDYVTFSGVFVRREAKSLRNHSGLITIDLDHLSDPDNIKQELKCDIELNPALIFISPSGDGLKVILPIDINAGSHSEYFDAISNYLRVTYSLIADPSGRDVSRACFLSHDLKVYLNPDYNDFF